MLDVNANATINACLDRAGESIERAIAELRAMRDRLMAMNQPELARDVQRSMGNLEGALIVIRKELVFI